MYLNQVIKAILKTAWKTEMESQHITIQHYESNKIFFDGTIEELKTRWESSHIFGASLASVWKVITFYHKLPDFNDDEAPVAIYNAPIVVTIL